MIKFKIAYLHKQILNVCHMEFLSQQTALAVCIKVSFRDKHNVCIARFEAMVEHEK
jgi:hypothetical protein